MELFTFQLPNELESGVDVSVLTEDGTTIPLPVGTYKTEDGVSF